MSTLKEQLEHFPYRIILGSASPRRQELLKSLGFEFRVSPVKADEDSWPRDLKAEEIPLWLAELKSNSYKEDLEEDEVLITSDTIVWCDDQVFNKPANFAEGKKMLEALSGKTHQVYTAVCLRSARKHVVFYDVANVTFKNLKGEEIEYYLTHFNPYDKAGGYGVQDWIGFTGIKKIEGSFYTVVGLPVRHLYEELLKF
jgi:septum formation protein